MAGNRIELKELVDLDVGIPGSDWKKVDCLIEAVCCPDQPYGKEFVALDPSVRAELMASFHSLFFRGGRSVPPASLLVFTFNQLTPKHPDNKLLRVYANIAATETQNHLSNGCIASINQPDEITLACQCMPPLLEHVRARAWSGDFWPTVMGYVKLGYLYFAAGRYEAAKDTFSLSLNRFPSRVGMLTTQYRQQIAQAAVAFGGLFEKMAAEHFSNNAFPQAYVDYHRACELFNGLWPSAKIGLLLSAVMLPGQEIRLTQVVDSLRSVASGSLDIVTRHENRAVSRLLPMLTISGDAANEVTDVLKFKAWVSAINDTCSLSRVIFAKQMDKVHSNIEKMLLAYPEKASAYLMETGEGNVCVATRAYAAVAIASMNRFVFAMDIAGSQGLAQFGASLQDPVLKRRYLELCCHHYCSTPPRSEQQYAEAIDAELQMICLEEKAGDLAFLAMRYNRIADYYDALSCFPGSNRHDEACTAISKAIERGTNPTSKAHYHLKRARWYRGLGKEQLARADVVAVRQLVPGAFELESDASQFCDEVNALWLKAGNDYLDANKLEEARSEFTQALSLSPKNERAMDALLFIELMLYPANSPCSEDFLLRLVNARDMDRTSVFSTLQSRLNILQRNYFVVKVQNQLWNVLRYTETDGLRQRMLKMSGLMEALHNKFSLLSVITNTILFLMTPFSDTLRQEVKRQISGELPHTDLMKAICAQVYYDDDECPPLPAEYFPDKKKVLPEGSTSHSISHSFTAGRSMSANTINPNDYSKLAGFYLQESQISEAIDAISQGLALPLPSAEVTYYNLYIQLSHLAPLMVPQGVQDILSRASGGFDGALEALRVSDTPESNLARSRLLAVVGRKVAAPVELERLPKTSFVRYSVSDEQNKISVLTAHIFALLDIGQIPLVKSFEQNKISMLTATIFALFDSNQIPLVKSLDEVVPAVLLEEFLQKIVKLRLSEETADFYNSYKSGPNYMGALKDALCNMAVPHSSFNRETLALQQELALLIIYDDRSFPGATARITRGVPIIGMTERMKKLLKKWDDFIAACPDKDLKIMLYMQRAIFFCDHQMWTDAFEILQEAKAQSANRETMECYQAYCIKEMSFLLRATDWYAVPKNRPPLKPCMPMPPTSSSAAAAAAAIAVAPAVVESTISIQRHLESCDPVTESAPHQTNTSLSTGAKFKDQDNDYALQPTHRGAGGLALGGALAAVGVYPRPAARDTEAALEAERRNDCAL